jgi:type IV pilus assembly protein PilQ
MRSSQMSKIIPWVSILILVSSCASQKASIQPPPTEVQTKAGKVSTIQKITFSEEENYTRINIEGSETIAPPFYKLLTDPLRIAIDVPNVDLRLIKEPIKVDNGTIGEIVATQYDDKGRIEIGLAQMANYNISKEDKNLIIDVEKVKRAAEVKEAEKEEGAVKEKEEKPPTQPTAPAPVKRTMNKAKEVVNFSLEKKKDFIILNIIADGRLENYNAFKLDSPARLVLDLWGVDTRYPKKTIRTKNPFIKIVRIGHHPDKLRLVFDSLKPQLPPYQINRIEDKLIVSIGNVPQPSEPQILLPEKTEEEGGPPPKTKVLVKAPIDFKQMDHKSRIVVTLTGEPKFESHTISKNTVVVDIKNAFVPKLFQRGLDTSQFESAVDYINIQNVKTGKVNDVRILIKLREEVPFETIQEGKILFIDIEKPKKVEAKIEALPTPRKEEVPVEAREEEAKKEEAKKEEVKKEEAVRREEGVKKEEEKPQPELRKPEKVLPAPKEKPAPQPLVIKKVVEEKKMAEERVQEKIYTGRKLSLDFKDADIKNILRLIAEVSNLNIIAGDDVTGKITMRLVDVPWDQALDIILQSRSLGMNRVGNVIRIAPLDTLKKEVQAELEAKRAKEKLEDLVTELISVNYATAKDLIPQIKHVLSDRGDIKVDERTNILIVKDIARNIALVRSLVKSLDTKTPQVLIEARIVEANMSFQRELGIKWGFLFDSGPSDRPGGTTGQVGGGITGTVFGTATHEVADLGAIARTAIPGATGALAAPIIQGILSRGKITELDIAISAHENKGDVKVISSPKIATLENKEASIEQGLRIPYPKLTTEGTVTTDFIDANLKLTVTPHVTNDGNIKLKIDAKKDAPDFTRTVLGVPSIDKKEAITEVMVKDEGVVVIAGIYTINKTDANEGIPLLSKIPLLGWVFKREAKEDTRTDLLIFISPKINKDQI